MQPFPKPEPGLPRLVLAPMEGVTDAPMRALQSELGAFDYCVSEFLRVCELVPPAKVFYRHVPELRNGCATPHGTPVQVQLLGGNPHALAGSALLAVELGAQAIDLNFGCPAPTVNRNDGGATLLKTPGRIRQIVAAVRSALPKQVPVSAKLRLGWDSIDAIHDTSAAAAEGGADWITIHGRTRMAGYAPPIYWKPIGEVRRRLHPMPVIANGDIWNMDLFKLCREQTGCEHFMLGRSVLANPNLSLEIAAELGVRPAHQEFGSAPSSWLALFERFQAHYAPTEDRSHRLARRIKQWTGYAARHGKVRWFDKIKRLDRYEEITQALQEMSTP